MAFNFFTGELTPEPHSMEAHQVLPSASELSHGDVGFASHGIWWVDLSGNTWLNGYAPVMTADDLPAHVEALAREQAAGMPAVAGEEVTVNVALDVCRIARIILPDLELDGYVVDVSSSNFVANGDVGEKIRRTNGPAGGVIPAERVLKSPVLAWAGNEAQLEVMEQSLREKYSISLGKTVRQIIAETHPESQSD